jgi:hypothetical protein
LLEESEGDYYDKRNDIGKKKRFPSYMVFQL